MLKRALSSANGRVPSFRNMADVPNSEPKNRSRLRRAAHREQRRREGEERPFHVRPPIVAPAVVAGKRSEGDYSQRRTLSRASCRWARGCGPASAVRCRSRPLTAGGHRCGPGSRCAEPDCGRTLVGACDRARHRTAGRQPAAGAASDVVAWLSDGAGAGHRSGARLTSPTRSMHCPGRIGRHPRIAFGQLMARPPFGPAAAPVAPRAGRRRCPGLRVERGLASRPDALRPRETRACSFHLDPPPFSCSPARYRDRVP